VINTQLAELSNDLVYAAMAFYLAALIVFSLELAATRVPAPRRERARDAALVGAAGGSGATVDVVDLDEAQATLDGSGADPLAQGGPQGRASLEPSSAAPDTAGGSAPPRGSRADKLGRVGVALTVAAFLLHLGAVVARAASAERVPWGNMYEFTVVGSLAITGVWLVLQWRRDVRWLGLYVDMAVLLALGLAVTVLYTESAQLVPALKSYWLVIHVSAAIVCSGVFALGAALSGLYLVKARAEARGSSGVIARRLPESGVLDRMAYRVIAFGFPLWTFAVIAGAIWAEQAWGRYWGWDPKETWAFITWVVYAGYLHARTTAGWRGKRAAWIALIGFSTFIFNYFGVNLLLPGLHSYSGL
jgi:cytochrome c-type biogenesis protein CcsB